MVTKRNLRQSFVYRVTEYRYRILEETLRNFKQSIGGRSVITYISASSDNIIRALWWVTCWNGSAPSESDFVSAWRHGEVRFRNIKNEHSLLGIHKLLKNAVVKYGIDR